MMTRSDFRKAQTYLANLGFYVGAIDGIAGPMTVTAVKLFQRSKGLLDDGIIGPRTWAAMFPDNDPAPEPEGKFYIGAAKRVDPDDADRIAGMIGVAPRAFRAVIKVESAGICASVIGGRGFGGFGGGFSIPSFDVGTAYVPQDTLAMVHKGERIIPAAQNRTGSGGHGPISMAFHLSGPADTRTQEQIARAAYSGMRRAQARTG